MEPLVEEGVWPRPMAFPFLIPVPLLGSAALALRFCASALVIYFSMSFFLFQATRTFPINIRRGTYFIYYKEIGFGG